MDGEAAKDLVSTISSIITIGGFLYHLLKRIAKRRRKRRGQGRHRK